MNEYFIVSDLGPAYLGDAQDIGRPVPVLNDSAHRVRGVVSASHDDPFFAG
jgi:hypothetical protein